MESRKVNLIFVGASVGIKTKKGGEMHIINLMQANRNERATTEAEKEKLICTKIDRFYFEDSDKAFVKSIQDKGFEFGDIVECEFTYSENLSREPDLIAINKLVMASPIKAALFSVSNTNKATKGGEK